MKKINTKKISIIFTFAIIIIFLFLFFVSKKQFLFAIPHIISSFYSKTFCSCHYVMQQSEKYCHEYSKQWIPIQNFLHDKKNRKVTVKGLWKTNTAYYTNLRNGCVLEPYK